MVVLIWKDGKIVGLEVLDAAAMPTCCRRQCRPITPDPGRLGDGCTVRRRRARFLPQHPSTTITMT
jgi:hypothetical protein